MQSISRRTTKADENGRTCSVCRIYKPHDQFFRDPRYAFGSGGRCKPCNALKGRRDRKQGLEKRASGLPDGNKKCSRCGVEKTVEQFNLCAHGSKGRQSECRECYHHTMRKCTFGITREQFESMLAAQNGVCAICGRPETVKRKGVVHALSVDHCHVTGKIRGLLCSRCNRLLGYVGQRCEGFLSKAQAYLDK